jgi:hypothetical protein
MYFEPELFHCITVKHNKITLRIFHSGKVVLLGVKRVTHLKNIHLFKLDFDWSLTFLFSKGFIPCLIYLQQINVVTRIDKHFGRIYPNRRYTSAAQLAGITNRKQASDVCASYHLPAGGATAATKGI